MVQAALLKTLACCADGLGTFGALWLVSSEGLAQVGLLNLQVRDDVLERDRPAGILKEAELHAALAVRVADQREGRVQVAQASGGP